LDRKLNGTWQIKEFDKKLIKGLFNTDYNKRSALEKPVEPVEEEGTVRGENEDDKLVKEEAT
jgi:hypothetical protein